MFDAAWKLRACGGDEQAVREVVEVSIEPLFRFNFYRVGRNRHRYEETREMVDGTMSQLLQQDT